LNFAQKTQEANPQRGFTFRLLKRIHTAGSYARDRKSCGFASGVCYACFQAWMHGLYPVRRFTRGKTPEVIAAKQQLFSPGKPLVFCGAKNAPEIMKF
jgi:hypothetical protein